MPAEPIRILIKVSQILERLAIPYLTCGSIASSILGIPRATQDIDLLIDLPLAKVEKFLKAMQAEFSYMALVFAACGRFTAQDFHEAGKCRVAWSPRDKEPFEQPCKATRIKGPIYLIDIKGSVHQGVCAPFFTNRVIMLQDYDHMMTVGCVMGQGFDPLMISGYAKFLN